MTHPFISDDYYDTDTYQLLLNTLNDDDSDYINNSKETITFLLFKRWRTIICSLSDNYYQQYNSKTTPQARNEWFKKYLDYPTKDISQMPEVL